MDVQIGWMGLGLGLLVLAAGVVIGRITSAATKRIRQLEIELTRAHDEMTSYRANVNQHFAKTAELLGILTANYRAVYEHLAAGAKALCTEEVVELSPAALRDRLLADSNEPSAPADSPHRDATPSPFQNASARPKAATTLRSDAYPDRLRHVNHIEDALLGDEVRVPASGDGADRPAAAAEPPRPETPPPPMNGVDSHPEGNRLAQPAGNSHAGSENPG